MIRHFISFVLRCRLENVMAAGVSFALLVFFLCTGLFHAFGFEMHDFIFILLPVGILGVKCLLEMLSNPESETNLDPAKYLVSFFRPLVKIVRDWFPFFLLVTCYYSLYDNLMLKINPHTADAFLSKIDAAMLGNQASILLEPWINPWATDFFNVIYFSFVFSLPAVALYFYSAKEEKVFRRVMMGYLTLMLMGITSYILVPAVGPGTFLADRFTRDLQGQSISHSVEYIISVGRVGYDCFPSLHVAIPLLLSFYLRDHRRKLFLPALIYVALMCCATIYLRFHYVTDIIASFAYAPAAYWLNDFLLAKWPGEKISASQVKNKK
jgi:membrane-associated phospholipid phosphatase